MTMDDPRLKAIGSGPVTPITEADLHAYADRQLPAERQILVEQFLSAHPDEQQRVRDWQHQNAMLRDMLAPVMDEPLPLGLALRPAATPSPWRGLAAGLLIAAISAGSAWSLRGALDAEATRLAVADAVADANATTHTSRNVVTNAAVTAQEDELAGFARRAAIAHVVYSPDLRRPVEVGADQEQALVTWLTRRLGSTVRPPALAALGYALIGGRLLPGEKGPVAQFMYGGADGQRLTLYVTREVPGQGDSAFQFGKDGPVNVFYWVENSFGYAVSAGTDRAELMRVSQEVYRQLKSA